MNGRVSEITRKKRNIRQCLIRPIIRRLTRVGLKIRSLIMDGIIGCWSHERRKERETRRIGKEQQRESRSRFRSVAIVSHHPRMHSRWRVGSIVYDRQHSPAGQSWIRAFRTRTQPLPENGRADRDVPEMGRCPLLGKSPTYMHRYTASCVAVPFFHTYTRT